MNWIDKIFKDQLGNRKFPDELRNKGKADLESLLAKEMPVNAANAAGKGGLFYGGLSILLLALVAIPAGIWYFQQDDISTENQQQYSLNFGQASVMSDAFVANSKVGSSGSWKVEGDNKPSIEEGVPKNGANISESKIQIESEQKVASALSSDNKGLKASLTEMVRAEKTEAIVADNVGNEVKSPSANKVDGNKTVDALMDKSESLTTANQEKSESEEPPKKRSERSAVMQLASAGIETNIEEVAVELDAQESVSQNTGIEPNEKEAEVANNEIVEEKVSETSVVDVFEVDVSETDKTQAVVEKLQKTGATEDYKSEVDEKIPSSVDDEKEEAVHAAVKLQLSNLAFSEVQTTSSPDLSQYKSLSLKRMGISMWGGYAYVGKSVKGGSDEYLNIRKEKEDAIYTIPTGLTFDYYLTRKWTLSIGAGFSEYGEVLNYDYEYKQKGYVDGRYGSPKDYTSITRLDSVRVITAINHGHWEYYFDYLESDSVIKNNNGQTQWSYVEVPVMFGYRFGSGKLKPWIQLGASVGIPYNQKFRYISPSGDGLQTNAEKGSIADVQINGLLNAGVDFYLNRYFSLRINAFGSYQLTPAYTFEGIEQRYYRLGGTLGLAYNF